MTFLALITRTHSFVLRLSSQKHIRFNSPATRLFLECTRHSCSTGDAPRSPSRALGSDASGNTSCASASSDPTRSLSYSSRSSALVFRASSTLSSTCSNANASAQTGSRVLALTLVRRESSFFLFFFAFFFPLPPPPPPPSSSASPSPRSSDTLTYGSAPPPTSAAGTSLAPTTYTWSLPETSASWYAANTKLPRKGSGGGLACASRTQCALAPLPSSMDVTGMPILPRKSWEPTASWSYSDTSTSSSSSSLAATTSANRSAQTGRNVRRLTDVLRRCAPNVTTAYGSLVPSRSVASRSLAASISTTSARGSLASPLTAPRSGRRSSLPPRS